mmetsp:Transcript_18546/g.25716  ORF Transcript_18546/g.25716 Transcript_18546/m.25716 type:complete len:329 (-) Transcript_18546:652-1638(-)
MSAGYASRLSAYSNKGVCGLPENFDTKRSLDLKLKKISKFIDEARHVVVLTGAGISTGAGIPDFRGPKGVWTLEKEQKKKSEKEAKKNQSINANSDCNGNKAAKTSPSSSKKRSHAEMESFHNHDNDFASAKPTLTHRAITRLIQDGGIQFCITQNVDGLHRRSGLKRKNLAILHGCVFTEKCEQCGTEHFRDYDVGGMSFQLTGRTCEHGCKTGALRDTLLDWEDELPKYDFERADQECAKADLCVCLGTSLRIEPAGSLPTNSKKFVIINLQETPYDGRAEFVVRAPVDVVMRDLMKRQGYDANWENEEMPAVETWSEDCNHFLTK